MRKKLFFLTAISAVSLMLPACGMLNKANSDMNAVNEASADVSEDNLEDENISEAEVSEESEEDNYFDSVNDSGYENSNTETSIDAEGNVYHDGYVLRKAQKTQMPVQAEVGYVSSVDMYTVIGNNFESETVVESTEETQETKKSKKEKETTAPETTAPETTVAETTPAETIVYPNLVGQ